MPKRLPGFVKLSISKVPEYMKPAAANGIFAPTAAHLANVKFRYIDNELHEPTSMEGCVAASGVGKGYLDEVYEANIKDLRQHDMESKRKLLEYARQIVRLATVVRSMSLLSTGNSSIPFLPLYNRIYKFGLRKKEVFRTICE